MLDAIVDPVVRTVLAVGAPLLVLLFYAEGLVVGKVLQPPAVFVAYVAIATPDPSLLVAVCAGCLLAATLGQWTLYRGFDEDAPEFVGLRRRVPYLDELPGRVQTRIGERRLGFVERIFARYGAVGICLTNLLPGVRCLVSIPAGLGNYPTGRFLLASTVGNLLYVALLVGVAFGVLEIAEFLV